MAVLANLLVFLGLDSAKFSAGLDEATKRTQKFEREQARLQKQANANAAALLSRVGTLAAGLVSIQGLLNVFQKADAVVDLARAFDTTAGAVLQAGKALELAGGKSEDITKIWSKLAIAQDGAREGSDKLRNAFAAIGISAKEVENLNPDELFQRVAEELAKIEDPVVRNAKAFELLGKSAKSISWKDYVKEYEKVVDPDLNAALEASAEAWDNIKKAVAETFNFTVRLVKPIADLINYLAKAKSLRADANTQIDYGAAAGIGITSDTIYVGEPEPNAKAQAAIEAQKKALQDKLKNAKDGYKIESAEDAAIRAANEQTKIQERLFGLEKARLSLAGERYRLNEFDARIADENLSSLGKIAQLEEQRTKVASQVKYGNEEAKRSKQIELANIDKQIEREKELNQIRVQNLEAEKARIYSFQAGWDEAYRKLIENNERLSNRAQQVFSALESGFDQVLDVIVGKSKRSFSDIAISIIQDLIKIQLKAQAVALIKGAGGLGGIGGFFGSIFGGGSPSPASLPGYSLFADGGDIGAGERSIVGERGPEVFVPKSAGSIIPNDKLVGGNGVTNNFYGPYVNSLSAIDTQSGVQFILRNKQAVWGANQSASRAQPVSR